MKRKFDKIATEIFAGEVDSAITVREKKESKIKGGKRTEKKEGKRATLIKFLGEQEKTKRVSRYRNVNASGIDTWTG